MQPVELNDNHRRHLGSAMHILRRMLDDFIRIVDENRRSKSHAFSEDQTKRLIANIAITNQIIDHLYVLFKLPTPREPAPDWSIQVGVARMWEMLEDCKSEKLRGYGDVPQTSISILDDEIQKLIDFIENIAETAKRKG
jgi:hypothetical protein